MWRVALLCAELFYRHLLVNTIKFKLNVQFKCHEHKSVILYLQVAVAVLTTMTITIYNYTLSITIQKAMDFSPYTRKYSTEIASFVTGGGSAILIFILSYVS